VNHRTLEPGQRAQVWIGGSDLVEAQLVLETATMLIEAPNWSPDGGSLLVNGNGQLWRIELAPRPELRLVDFTSLPEINNDHVLSPDGRHIYLSAMDGHVYRGPVEGGQVERVTVDDKVWHFLHGVSPDGTRLAYVMLTDFAAAGRLAVMAPNGPSTIIDIGDGHVDGPEW
jgi:TolB protein